MIRLAGTAAVQNDDDDDDDEDENDDDDEDDQSHHQQQIRKQVAFPAEMERGDVQASHLVTKVSTAIAKRLTKLDLHKEKLASGTTDAQKKQLVLKCFEFTSKWRQQVPTNLDANCAESYSYSLGTQILPLYANSTCTNTVLPRLLEKVESLKKALTEKDELMMEKYSKGLVDGFKKSFPVCIHHD